LLVRFLTGRRILVLRVGRPLLLILRVVAHHRSPVEVVSSLGFEDDEGVSPSD
jgi:hypothetical protein